jgi:hypothetical protein
MTKSKYITILAKEFYLQNSISNWVQLLRRWKAMRRYPAHRDFG